MVLPDNFIKNWQIKDYDFVQQFKSKKNQVLKLKVITKNNEEHFLVCKSFTNYRKYYQELSTLNKLSKIDAPVPRLLYSSNKIIITEYIDGFLLVDELFKGGNSLINELGKTLERVYNALAVDSYKNNVILGDMNLRNFIIDKNKNKIYRLDFESVEKGHLSKDIGKLCAFCISYDPPFTDYKLNLTKELFDYFKNRFLLSSSFITNEVLIELSNIEKRREIVVPEKVKYNIYKW
ncbi:serine/threonine protein kinase [Natranaerobius thermophilus]|uniref:Mn2+-dependent serine/threonine protein kinase n=1 Tax=Natranaerobius thermophilus (strain ATCC BAA-1301 / DSM 18059 / JW/NM-WN-LF) TaxID=457570 RepID=B2A5A2_NATTJ|nr:serine/threonine protein kinase [Natranaerobius thermophilus]ACB83936.1 Mn2+-dependent serine/threonine protein kinase [Natranaerobius thermophilus JW/NM-WN-LF]